MGNRITIDTYRDLLNASRRDLLSGLTDGKRDLASTVFGIIMTAVSFGHDEFDRKPKDRTAPGASVDFGFDSDGYTALVEHAKEYTIEGLFEGKGLDRIARDVTLMGVAWGRQKAEAENDGKFNREAEDLLKQFNKAYPKTGKVRVISDEDATKFLELLMKAPAAVAINYARRLLAGDLFGINTTLPVWTAFVKRYATLIPA